MSKKTDARIIKSKAAIQTAFIELLEEKGFQKISASEIIQRADINRSTFYAHYNDKFDLMNSIENELFFQLHQIAEQAPLDALASNQIDNSPVASHILRVLTFFTDNNRILTLLTSENGDPTFIVKLQNHIMTTSLEKHMDVILPVPVNYASAAVLGMLSGLLVEWIKGGYKETPEEFIDIILKIIKYHSLIS